MKCKKLFVLSCVFFFANCGLHQSVKNKAALSDISIGMTQNEVESHLVFFDGEQFDSRSMDTIKTLEGETFLLRWYRIDFDTTYATPFIYKDNKLIGFGHDYLKTFSVIHGFQLYPEKRGKTICYIPMYPKNYSGKKAQDENDFIESYDPYLGKKIKKYDKEYALYEKNANEWKTNVEQWNKDYDELNQAQTTFLKSLSIEQLEMYAKYEDSIKENKTAYRELYSRKLSSSLSPIQKNQLTKLCELGDILFARKKILDKQDKFIVTERDRLGSEHASIKEYVKITYDTSNRIQSSQTSPEEAGFKAFADGLNKVAEDMRWRSDQLQMYQINNSLQDISRAIRKY